MFQNSGVSFKSYFKKVLVTLCMYGREKMSFMSEGEDRCLLFRVLYIFVGLQLLAHEPHDSSPAEKKITVVISSAN